MFGSKLFSTLLLLTVLLTQGFAKEIKVAIGLTLPPYVLSETNTGIEYDIVKEALALKGHTIVPKYTPFARVVVDMRDGKVDAAITVNESANLGNVHFTDSHIFYQNVAVSLKKNGYNIEKISDLSKHSIIAFQNATKYLGDEFKKMAKGNGGYRELASQENQVALLFKERTQAVVGDINIFKYFRSLTKLVDTSAQVDIHKIFPKTEYKVAFKDKALVKDFNEGLAQLKASGRYDKIFKQYIK